MFTTLKGFIVATSDAALAFVLDSDAKTVGINPLYIPLKKLDSQIEMDEMSCEIQTGKIGLRVGLPAVIKVDSAWLARINPALV